MSKSKRAEAYESEGRRLLTLEELLLLIQIQPRVKALAQHDPLAARQLPLVNRAISTGWSLSASESEEWDQLMHSRRVNGK